MLNRDVSAPRRTEAEESSLPPGVAIGTPAGITTLIRALPVRHIGLETALALALECLVFANSAVANNAVANAAANHATTGKISLNRMVELFTTGPEAVMRLGRGTLAPGAPGDVTVFSTDAIWTYDVNQSPSRSRNSPFHGKTFRGGPMATVVNGVVVWSRG